MAKIPVGPGGADVPQVLANDPTLGNILDVVYFWAGIVAVLVIIIAGFFYVTANGNAQTIERAKNAILGAVIGLVVVMMAFGITRIIVMIGQSG